MLKQSSVLYVMVIRCDGRRLACKQEVSDLERCYR